MQSARHSGPQSASASRRSSTRATRDRSCVIGPNAHTSWSASKQEKAQRPAGSGHNGRVTTGSAVEQDLADALDEVIRERAIVPLYQPIFEISEAAGMTPEQREVAVFPVVAYEAPARGPRGAQVGFPDSMPAPAH